MLCAFECGLRSEFCRVIEMLIQLAELPRLSYFGQNCGRGQALVYVEYIMHLIICYKKLLNIYQFLLLSGPNLKAQAMLQLI